MNALTRWLSDESGASAIEYGALIAAISIACVALWAAMGGDVAQPFETISAALQKV